MTADNTHLLAADNLRISRGMAVVLEKISLAISAGQAMVITGPNGSGKTTLLRGLAGLLPLDHGEVRLMGVSSRDDRQHLQDHLIYIGHKDGLSGALTTLENMQLWAQCHNLVISDAEMEKAFGALMSLSPRLTKPPPAVFAP
jgi:heme exporter protein A